MELIRPRSWGMLQPPPGAQINWGHPLAQGLVACWLLSAGGRSLVSPFDTLALVGTAGWGVGPTGHGLRSMDNDSGAVLAVAPAPLKPAKKVSILWRGAFYGDGNRGSYPPIVGLGYSNPHDNGMPYPYGFLRPGTSADNVYYLWNNGSAQASDVNVSLSTRYHRPIQLVLTLDGDGAIVRGYDGANQVLATTTAGTISYTATSWLRINQRLEEATNTTDSFTSLVAIWNRDLKPSEVAWLNAEPYAFLNPPAPKGLYFPLSAAAAVYKRPLRVARQAVNRSATR